MKNIVAVLSMIFTLSLLTGCMDYKGIDETTVVVGIAVDKSEEEGQALHVSFETINTTGSQEEAGKTSSLVEADGTTIYEAIENANKQLYRELFFGNTDLLIIHEELAKESGINGIVESFLRDYTTRDTLQLIVSRAESAKKLIEPNEENPKIFSYEITKSLDYKTYITDSFKTLEIYEIYDDLKRGTGSLVLPAFVFNEEQIQPETDGLAIFKEDKLMDFLVEEDVSDYLYIVKKIKEGAFVFPFNGDEEQMVTQNIISSTPEINTDYVDGQAVITVNLMVETNISSMESMVDSETIEAVERQSAVILKERLEALVARMQAKGEDIFGFAVDFYSNNNADWTNIKNDWDEVFRKARVTVIPEFNILNTGLIGNY